MCICSDHHSVPATRDCQRRPSFHHENEVYILRPSNSPMYMLRRRDRYMVGERNESLKRNASFCNEKLLFSNRIHSRHHSLYSIVQVIAARLLEKLFKANLSTRRNTVRVDWRVWPLMAKSWKQLWEKTLMMLCWRSSAGKSATESAILRRWLFYIRKRQLTSPKRKRRREESILQRKASNWCEKAKLWLLAQNSKGKFISDAEVFEYQQGSSKTYSANFARSYYSGQPRVAYLLDLQTDYDQEEDDSAQMDQFQHLKQWCLMPPTRVGSIITSLLLFIPVISTEGTIHSD